MERDKAIRLLVRRLARGFRSVHDIADRRRLMRTLKEQSELGWETCRCYGMHLPNLD